MVCGVAPGGKRFVCRISWSAMWQSHSDAGLSELQLVFAFFSPYMLRANTVSEPGRVCQSSM
jgi:hypothetical protein